MKPIYTAHNTKPAYQLNWGLTLFWRQTPVHDGNWLSTLQEVTEADGVRVIKHQITGDGVSQFFISSKPPVSPPQLIRSVKGRLQPPDSTTLAKGVSPQLLSAKHRIDDSRDRRRVCSESTGASPNGRPGGARAAG